MRPQRQRPTSVASKLHFCIEDSRSGGAYPGVIICGKPRIRYAEETANELYYTAQMASGGVAFTLVIGLIQNRNHEKEPPTRSLSCNINPDMSIFALVAARATSCILESAASTVMSQRPQIFATETDGSLHGYFTKSICHPPMATVCGASCVQQVSVYDEL